MDQAKEFHNLDDTSDGLFRELAPGVTTRIFSGEQTMLSVVSLAPNAQGSLHHHPEEQWGVLLEGSAVRVQDGEEIPIKKGDFWRTPGNVPHTMRAGPEGARVLDVFSPPRPEYRKPGSGFAAPKLAEVSRGRRVAPSPLPAPIRLSVGLSIPEGTRIGLARH